jgi:hypothetical protein
MEGYQPKSKMAKFHRFYCFYFGFLLLFIPFLLICVGVIAVTHSMLLCIGTGILSMIILYVLIKKFPTLENLVTCDDSVEAIDKVFEMRKQMRKKQ